MTTIDRLGRTPVFQQIAAVLRADIEAGELRPGQRIPGERTIMRRFGVAQLTARRAVQQLVAEGLVEVETGRGAYVVPQMTPEEFNRRDAERRAREDGE